MTNKDLNLALDQNLIQPTETQQTSTQEPSTHPHHEAANLDTTINPSADSSNNYQRQHNRYNKTPSSLLATWFAKLHALPWLASGLIVINLLFLLLAGLWLSNHNSQSATITSSKTMPLNSSDVKTIESINQNLAALQTKVEQIELTLHEQQRLIATSSKDLSNDIEQLNQKVDAIKLLTTEKSKPAPKKEVSKPISKKPATHWYVNIGTFSSKDAAQRLQKQLLTLGHSVQINTTSFDNKPAYRVQLPGFKDREAAESTARQIMEKTNLNGLWAWKDE